MNPRADLFNEDLKINMPNTFNLQEFDDEAKTVVFKSNISVKEQTLPLAVFLDNTVFPMVRVFVAGKVVNDDNRSRVLACFNEMNKKYKVFKYYEDELGDIIVDACVPALDENFAPKIIHVVIEAIVNHLNEDYSEIMNAVWGKKE